MSVNKIFIERALYPAMEALKGNRVRQYLAEMKQTQYMTKDEIQAIQNARLKKLLHTCVASVPAYQNLHISDDDIEKDPFSVLRQIPILKKGDFQKNPTLFINTEYDKSLMIPNSTGGSTGEPLKFFMDRYDVEHYEAARWRGLLWHGITFGSRSVMIWGNPIELSTNKQMVARFKDNFLKNRTIISAYDLTQNEVNKYISFLNRYQPEYIYGYATALYTFAQLLLPIKEKLKLRNIKAAVSTSETLHDYQREVIREAFGCPVANEYGARDAGILAYECPCGNLHITAENVIFEVVDPITYEPVPDGQSGVVITTDLNNLAMPRLRYLLGDTATLSVKQDCPCGVTLPIVESLDGREDTIFKLADGKLVHGNFINQLSRKYKSIAQFQLIQTDIHHATLKLVMKESLDRTEITPFKEDIMEFLPGVTIDVKIVSKIAPSRSGKIRYSMRDFDL